MKDSRTYAMIAAAVLIAAIVFFAMKFGPAAKNSVPLSATALPAAEPSPAVTPEPPAVPMYHYIEIVDGCDWNFAGACVNLRSGPGTNFSSLIGLRTGIVLKVEAATVEGADGHSWYKVIFDGDIRYPERVKGDWYVAVDPEAVRSFDDPGDSELKRGEKVSTTKRIVVDLSKEMLYAYDGDTLFMQDQISTGLDSTPTPPGTFRVYKKTPSRYMQGPIPGVSDQYYDLPGVPWDLYFTVGGAVVHGAYWHDHFGEPWSHGCVNLPPEEAKKLYEWADLGMPVIVQN